eukprot:TRINITY_DN18269_c0_g1_i3.p2 TRINITY_DN18269_c0_g1~~TRINITY_DN18269_c0_g1_i3.p2  ORF type:complete len:100 (-),score=28.73 TRINITY_DN18269_c0_g1_i3:139-438(-)
MIRRPPRSTLSSSSAASDVYKRQDVGGADDLLGVNSAGVADGDGSVLLEEKLGDGKSDDVTTSDDDGVLSGNGDTSALQHLDNTHGGCLLYTSPSPRDS